MEMEAKHRVWHRGAGKVPSALVEDSCWLCCASWSHTYVGSNASTEVCAVVLDSARSSSNPVSTDGRPRIGDYPSLLGRRKIIECQSELESGILLKHFQEHCVSGPSESVVSEILA